MKEIIALCTALLITFIQSGVEQHSERESKRSELLIQSTKLFLETHVSSTKPDSNTPLLDSDLPDQGKQPFQP